MLSLFGNTFKNALSSCLPVMSVCRRHQDDPRLPRTAALLSLESIHRFARPQQVLPGSFRRGAGAMNYILYFSLAESCGIACWWFGLCTRIYLDWIQWLAIAGFWFGVFTLLKIAYSESCVFTIVLLLHLCM